MSSPGITPEFDDDTIDTLHTRWSARSARFQAMVTGAPAAAVPPTSGCADDSAPDTALAS
ncbi:hypothetical protein GCM10009818_05880 [Nakamurella flavida]